MSPTPPTLPLPEVLPLPGPAWFLHALLLLPFTLHVIAMNLMLGGAMVVTALRWRRAPGRAAQDLASVAGRSLPPTVAATVTFGVAALVEG